MNLQRDCTFFRIGWGNSGPVNLIYTLMLDGISCFRDADFWFIIARFCGSDRSPQGVDHG